jgi:type IV secretory pathway TrbL component
MEYTQNYKLKKPGQEDFYNVDDFNSNADIIDQKLKEIEDKTKNIVTSVNGKTGDVELKAEDIGAETPAGAQTKANQAEANAKAYTDQQISTVANDLASHKNDIMPHKFTAGSKTYRWGFRIINSQPQFIYEEVTE